MKTTPHSKIANHRTDSDPRAPRHGRSFPETDQNYQASKVDGSCGTPLSFKSPAFFEISNDYFAGEAARGFAVDAGVFAALFLTALLPIVNSVQAVATLVHTLSVL